MIVFIATVLVAAIAAGVLLETGGKLQERSARTGNQATEQVSSNLFVMNAVGKRNATSDEGLKYLEFYVTLAPGAENIDLGQLRVTILNETVQKNLEHSNEANPDANEFNATEIRDSDGSFTGASPVVSPGDYVKILIDTAVNSMEFAPRSQIDVALVPEIGPQVNYGVTTPPSYGVSKIVVLR